MAREVCGCADAHADVGAVLALQARIDALVGASQRWAEGQEEAEAEAEAKAKAEAEAKAEAGAEAGAEAEAKAEAEAGAMPLATRVARRDALLAALAHAIADVRRALYAPVAVHGMPPVRRHGARLAALAAEAAYADAFAAFERRVRLRE